MKEVQNSIFNRMFLMLGLVFLLPCAILFQILRIDIWQGKNLRKLWSDQAIGYIPITAQRGDILDDHGKIMATNTVAYHIAIDPHFPKITTHKILSVCSTLAKYTPHTSHYYLHKIRMAPSQSRYVVLNKSVSIDAYDALKQLDIHGLILNERYKRRYNYDSLAANVLGYVNHNMNGMTGLEAYYNEQLKGEDGLQQVRRDRQNHIQAIVGAPRKRPINGYSLKTTLDVHIQAIVEEELRDGVKRSKAEYGTAIVMDPKTGAVKAMADYPTFDPNRPGVSIHENRRNYAISDMIEPGSTFKLVTATAAIQQGVITMNEKFKTPKDGKKLIHGQWMRDHEPLGTMTFPRVIQESSDIATADIAMRLKPSVFYQYARNLGFGAPTNIDLPDEQPGVLKKPYQWTQVSLPWMAIGYEEQVTPIQLAQAYSAFANDGIMMRPYIVKAIVDQNGNVVKRINPVKVRRVAKKTTIKKLLPVFHGVVSDSGTAAKAQVQGLPIAGKTGTAQKYTDGSYHLEHVASFVGFFPVHNPQYVCLVIVTDPKTSIYGGQVSAPIFHNIAKRLIGVDPKLQQIVDKKPNAPHFLIVPGVKGLTKKQAETFLADQGFSFQINGKGSIIVGQTPSSGTEIEPHQPIKLVTGSIDHPNSNQSGNQDFIHVPDVKGLSMREATHLLTKAGLKVKIIGSGTVFAQFPKPKALMQAGHSVTIRGKEKSLTEIINSK